MSLPKWLRWTVPKAKVERLKHESEQERKEAEAALDNAKTLLRMAQQQNHMVRLMEADVRRALRRDSIGHKLEVAMKVMHR